MSRRRRWRNEEPKATDMENTNTLVGLLDNIDYADRDRWAEAQRKQEREYNERVAALQAQYDSIESDFVPILRAEIAIENQTARVTARNRKDFAKFKTWCELEGFPYLPANPAAVLLFLGSQVEYGPQYIARLSNAIATLHLATGFTSPCDDVLIRALTRLLRNEKDQTKPQQKVQTDDNET